MTEALTQQTLAQNTLAPTGLPPQFPDHTQLPESGMGRSLSESEPALVALVEFAG